MAVEVELKVHVDDMALIKKRLSALGEYCGSYKKSDSYWFPVETETGRMAAPPVEAASTGLRVRHENGVNAQGTAHETVLVTYKTKEISDGIEVNNESEFSVSDAGLFEELLGRLGLYRDIGKEKEGWSWTIPPEAAGQVPILAELSLVANLGWFLELEILLTDNNEQSVEESRLRLLACLGKLEISSGQAEAKPYTVMLKDLGVRS